MGVFGALQGSHGHGDAGDHGSQGAQPRTMRFQTIPS